MKGIALGSQKVVLFFPVLSLLLSLGSAAGGEPHSEALKERIIHQFSGKAPREWGEKVTGVKTRLNTDRPAIALTLDACGGTTGGGFDTKLIAYLEREKIPATLFISGPWIDTHREVFQTLAQQSLFEIENHGRHHKPCSVSGRSVYGIRGPSSVAELIDEIEIHARRMERQTGRLPRCYRPGTGYCDEIGVQVANALGYEVVNYSVLGDAGGTYPKRKVREALLRALPSSIVLLHMNRPEGETAEGVMEAIPELRKRGITFHRLSEHSLR